MYQKCLNSDALEAGPMRGGTRGYAAPGLGSVAGPRNRVKMKNVFKDYNK